jgi:predicted NBD/HSP70 family sugar kinase
MAATIGPSSENTRSAVLDLIRSGGVVSRVDLVEASGLTAPSITRIVKVLIDDGLVIETGFGDSTGGKRRTLLELNASARYAIGLSLDDARLTYVVTDLAGNLVGRLVAEGVRDATPAVLISRITEELHTLLTQLDVKTSDVVGLGLARAGLRDRVGGVPRGALAAGVWGDFEVREALEASSGFTVVVENDAACAALGEFWTGRLPATKDFATLYMATGIGCGIVIGGSVYGGASLNAGEIGHMIVDVNGPDCWCGSRGCLEMLAAPRSVVKRAMADTDLATALSLTGTEAELRTDFAVIARAGAQGDPRCVALVEESANYLAAALLSLTNLIDLDQLYLAGPGFADAGSIYYRIIRSRLESFAFQRAVHSVTVELSEVGLESAALGAAAVVLQSELTPHRKAAVST